jgi:hypothetical protein
MQICDLHMPTYALCSLDVFYQQSLSHVTFHRLDQEDKGERHTSVQGSLQNTCC